MLILILHIASDNSRERALTLVPSLRIPTRKHFFRRQYWHWLRWCWSIWHSLLDLAAGGEEKNKTKQNKTSKVRAQHSKKCSPPPTPSLALCGTLPLWLTPVMSELCEPVWLKSYQGFDLCKSSALHALVLPFTAGRALPTIHRELFLSPPAPPPPTKPTLAKR